MVRASLFTYGGVRFVPACRALLLQETLARKPPTLVGKSVSVSARFILNDLKKKQRFL